MALAHTSLGGHLETREMFEIAWDSILPERGREHHILKQRICEVTLGP